jgi:hypothetical protein
MSRPPTRRTEGKRFFPEVRSLGRLHPVGIARVYEAERAHEARPERSVSRHEHEENEAEIGDRDDGEVDPPAARIIAPVERHRGEDRKGQRCRTCRTA